MLDKYPDDLKLVIKHFPLRMHKFAEKASIAALAAEKQGKYMDLSRVMLKNYKKLSDTTVKQHAEAVGLDMAKFEKACADPALNKQIKEDMGLGRTVGVRGVPALFINGRSVKSRSLGALSTMVEQELKKKK